MDEQMPCQFPPPPPPVNLHNFNSSRDKFLRWSHLGLVEMRKVKVTDM